MLERVARISNPRSIVWRGSQLPSELQGIKILGTPLGHPEFVTRHLQGVLEEQRVFLNRIPLVSDIQSAWLLLLHCANARANYQIRSVTPEGVEAYARAHDDGIWQCFCELLELDPTAGDKRREIANLLLLLGGLGLRSASRLRESAHWASWADCLEMIHQRHPDVANWLVAVGRPSRHSMSACGDDSSEVHHRSHGVRTPLMDSTRRRSPTCSAPARGFRARSNARWLATRSSV